MAEQQLFSNNASSTLAASIVAADASLDVAFGTGSEFANSTSGYVQMLTLVNADETVIEIVKVTNAVGDTFTVVRGQEGTTAADWPAGTKIEARLTAGMLERLAQNRADPATTSAMALGWNADAVGDYSTALGAAASTAAAYSLAANGQAVGSGSTAVNGSAYADHSVALKGYAYTDRSLAMSVHPTIQRNDWDYPITDSFANAGMEGVFSANYVDLGNMPAWQASTSYKDGAVVRPVTPNGLQYALWTDYNPATTTNSITTTSTEPTWPTGDAESVFANAAETAEWIAMDIDTNGIEMALPRHTLFIPSEVGFICFNHANVTAAPYVSFGSIASPTNLVNNQQLTQITGSMQVHRFTSLPNLVISDGIKFTLNTKATGTNSQFHGRLYVKGMFIQTQD